MSNVIYTLKEVNRMMRDMISYEAIRLLYFAIGSLVFSVIFWLTHNWLKKK